MQILNYKNYPIIRFAIGFDLRKMYYLLSCLILSAPIVLLINYFYNIKNGFLNRQSNYKASAAIIFCFYFYFPAMRFDDVIT